MTCRAPATTETKGLGLPRAPFQDSLGAVALPRAAQTAGGLSGVSWRCWAHCLLAYLLPLQGHAHSQFPNQHYRPIWFKGRPTQHSCV